MAVALLCACAESPSPPEVPVQQALRYDREYPSLEYSTRVPDNRITRLDAQLRDGSAALQWHEDRGYLDSLLAALQIDARSQVLVFSGTSLQVEGIAAATPRAIYFNDDTWLAWVRGAASLEIGVLDDALGPVFYTLAQMPDALPEQRFELCLSCHDSYSLTGGGVPRFITGSGYVDKAGNIAAHEGWILTNDRTPLRNRWGGWYVTGMHGEQVHLGNIAVDSVYDLENLESLRNGNYEDLSSLIDASPYLTDTSDIVALLVMDHQVTVQNAIVRLNWDWRQNASGAAQAQAAAPADIEPLVRALVFSGTPQFTDPISGTAGFEQGFLSRARRDAQGRALRDFDLRSRLFVHPLSYLVHSSAFAALPEDAIRAVLNRVREELTSAGRYDDIPGSAEERAAAWEIFLAVSPLVDLVP